MPRINTANTDQEDLRRQDQAEMSVAPQHTLDVPVCPKCGARSGDDWSQCRKRCPMAGSPHFDETTAAVYGS